MVTVTVGGLNTCEVLRTKGKCLKSRLNHRKFQPNDGLVSLKYTGGVVLSRVRGGWTRYKCYLNILLLIVFFSLVFHVILNSRNTKLKSDGVHWGSLDIQIVLHIGFKAVYLVFSKHLRSVVKLFNCDLMHTTSPGLSRTFSIMKQRPFTALH